MPAVQPITKKSWIGVGSRAIVPPADYWAHLASVIPGNQVDRLKELSDSRLTEFSAHALPPPENTAVELLDCVAAAGWLESRQRQCCSVCRQELAPHEASEPECPHCGVVFGEGAAVATERIYVRDLTPSRDVDWVIAIHGMNTSGAWQEKFSWHVGTTWGRSVPVAVYKYGIVVAGVIMAWRRRNLQSSLRQKLVVLRDEAQARGFSGRPDVIAHSFGTWLFGHLVQEELRRPQQEQLQFGRIILAGCILRPDFDWRRVRDAGVVEEVLNHYGSRDSVVPIAHVTIRDSGPSGRRGFDGDQVLNVRADGYGHSDLFSTEKCVSDGKPFQDCGRNDEEVNHLEHSYKRYWRPFLTLPRTELYRLPDRADPTTTWRPMSWPLRGTLFPFLALPLVCACLALAVAALGESLWALREHLAVATGFTAAGLGLILGGVGMTWLWMRLKR